jgi:Flp pilus assembly protein TadG
MKREPATGKPRATTCRRLSPKNWRCKRRGAAAVEFAVVLPVVVFLFLGAVELSRGVMIDHSLQEAARAGCRVYSVATTPQQEVDDILAVCMNDAGVTNYQVVFDPATKAEIDKKMEPVTVSISVAYSDVAWLSPRYLSGATITASCTLPADLEETVD